MQEHIQSSIKNQPLLIERRKQIIMAAIKLFMARGFEGTSIRAIAKATGLTVGALYRYIGSKDDLLWLTTDIGNSYHKKLHEKMQERVKGLRSVDALKESIMVYFRSADGLQDVYTFHNHIVLTASKELRQSIFDRESHTVEYFNQLLTEGVNVGEFEIEDTYLTAHNIVVAANAWANRRWLLRKRYTLEDYIRIQTNSILNSIQPERVRVARTGTLGKNSRESKGE